MEPFWLGVFGVALFALSASASAIYHGRMRRCAQPAPGTQLTLRSGGAHLRCRFISARRGKWVVTPLTIVGAVCPTRLTGDMIARFGTAAGVVVFATRVVGADGLNVLLAAPKDARVLDRRLSPRVRFEPALAGILDGAPVAIQNLGTRGAMVRAERGLAHGAEVVLQPEGTVARMSGFVLACDSVGTDYRIRVLFDREVPLSFCWELANGDVAGANDSSAQRCR